METLVRTPSEVFYLPQRLLVPLFQRPYVWSEEGQWQLLWDDIRRRAEQLLADGSVPPHFLGAVVLQNHVVAMGDLPRRTIIDGQQRLTTLQLALDAAHQVLDLAGASMVASQVGDLTMNPAHFCRSAEDRFKVWPTNRDRASFNEVMSADLPVRYDTLTGKRSKMTLAHEFFSTVMNQWVHDGDVAARCEKLAHVLTKALQLVVIELGPDEDSQQIFETLNARGTPLTAADLIKNFVFQRLALEATEAERAYHDHWSLFETNFWEREVGAGRNALARSSLFLNQWLVAQTGEVIGPRATFTSFKQYAEHSLQGPMDLLLPQLHETAVRYQGWVDRAATRDGDLSPLELFVYRTQALDSETVKPFLLWLTDDSLGAVPSDQFIEAIGAVESWLVRRTLLRLSTTDHGRVMAALIAELRTTDRSAAGDRTTAHLARQDADGTYWPGDDEMRGALGTLPAYRRYKRTRLRMVLEAIEDHLRGYGGTKASMTGARVPRDALHIEHLLPRQWRPHWPVQDQASEQAREQHVDLLGNLTLLTQGLNSSVSNGPWLGDSGKRSRFQTYDVVLMNRWIHEVSAAGWDEELIGTRTQDMIAAILAIWPVPDGHTGTVRDRTQHTEVYVTLADLVLTGILASGTELRGRASFADARATVLKDGRLQIGEELFDSPSGAGQQVRQGPTNGWLFWRVADGRTLKDLRMDYLATIGREDVEDDRDDTEDAVEADLGPN